MLKGQPMNFDEICQNKNENTGFMVIITKAFVDILEMIVRLKSDD